MQCSNLLMCTHYDSFSNLTRMHLKHFWRTIGLGLFANFTPQLKSHNGWIFAM